jgi:hypothetical protein
MSAAPRWLVSAVLASAIGWPSAQAQQLAFTPFHANGIYAVGERVGWHVAVAPGQSPAPGRYRYTVKRDGATVVGLDAYLGRLEVGLHGDVTVFGRIGADTFQAVIDSRAQDVRLVLLDGMGLYGDDGLEAATAVNTNYDIPAPPEADGGSVVGDVLA